MDDQIQKHWLGLARLPGVGPVTAKRLLAAFATPAALFESSATRLREVGLGQAAVDFIARFRTAVVATELRWLEGAEHHLVTLADAHYPPQLREIPDAPPTLFAAGDPACLAGPQLAVVGSRNPSPTGREHARRFAAGLSGAGWTVTSGLATGIDAEAHRAALDAGAPTVAVLGSGPDCIYPSRHRGLAQAVQAQGCLLSEFAPGTGPRREHFPRRNRLISGLSRGCLVVEATCRSGSLVTARHAAEQGREVFAVPGSIDQPLAHGCHRLLREGATLVETLDDILQELPGYKAPDTASAPAAHNHHQSTDLAAKWCEYVDFEPVSVDQLVQRTGLTAAEVSSMLLRLELRGDVATSPGGLYCRVKR